MLVTLHSRKSGISDKSKKKLLKDLETFAEDGLAAPTVEAFNEFINEMVLINENLKKPKPPAELEEYYVDAAKEALGEVLSVKLDVKILTCPVIARPYRKRPRSVSCITHAR